MSDYVPEWQQWKLYIGVDVGGTNTDAVLMDGRTGDGRRPTVLAKHKKQTSEDVTSGVANCIQCTLQKCLELPACNRDGVTSVDQLSSRVLRVCIGTTHFVNAIVQRRGGVLAKVAVLRLCGKTSRGVPPFCDFPAGLARCVQFQPAAKSIHYAAGGHEYNAKPMSEVDVEEIRRIAKQMKDDGVRHVVVSAVFSTLHRCNTHELQVAEILRDIIGSKLSITLSHQVAGGLGLLERENAAIMNESLRPLCAQTVCAFAKALDNLGFRCPFFLTKNDGTLISASRAKNLPVLAFSSGPTNSIRGAHFLTLVTDGVVIDLGGTTSDAGYIQNGYPRQASSEVRVAGVSINFTMPDTLSIGLGGGSHVEFDDVDSATVGPLSVGYKLETADGAYIFNGSRLTASDVAVASGRACAALLREYVEREEERKGTQGTCEQRLATVGRARVDAAWQRIQCMVTDLIDVVKGSNDNVTVILVGGGSILVDTSSVPAGVARFVTHKDSDVANAVGAALGQIGFVLERNYELPDNDGELRRKFLDEFEEEARSRCEKAGALKSTIAIHGPIELRMGYMPGFRYRVTYFAVGDVDDSAQIDLHHEDDDALDLFQGDGADKDEATGGAAGLGSPQAKRVPSPEPLLAEEDPMLCGVPPATELEKNAEGDITLDAYGTCCIVRGAAIIGCGGGGSPKLAEIRCLRAVSEGKKIVIVQPERICSEGYPELDGVVGNLAFMGVPEVIKEKLVAGAELRACVRGVQKMWHGDPSIKEGQKVAGITPVVDGCLDDVYVAPGMEQATADYIAAVTPNSEHQRMVALMPLEVGGMNCIEPLVLAAELGLVVVDCDGMGRAFPEYQMFCPFIYGAPQCPCVLVAPDGSVHAATAADSAEQLERYMRLKCVELGCIAAIGGCPLSKDDLMTKSIRGSLTRCYEIGNAVLRARRANTDPVAAIVEKTDGRIVVRGKITENCIEILEGFSRGKFVVQAFASVDPAESRYRVHVQNEFICCFRVHSNDENDRNPDNLVVCAPHLITAVDVETGYPITTEELRVGQRVAILAIRADPLLLTPQALPVVGPTYFMPEKQYGFKLSEPVFPNQSTG